MKLLLAGGNAAFLLNAAGLRWASAQMKSPERLVRNPGELDRAIRQANAGDTVLMADGDWRDVAILLEGHGRPEAPITLAAQTPGHVILSGRASLRLSGTHLIARGLTFRNGFSPKKEVIAFHREGVELANHCRLTDTVIDGFNNPAGASSESWLSLLGRNNRIDHCRFQGKTTKGPTVAIRLDRNGCDENQHQIDHNLFGPRPPLDENGAETIRIGTGAYAHLNSSTLIEDNIFEGCDGELEIVSIKSCWNTVRRNVFLRSRGTVTFRQGHHNLVESNLFLGMGLKDTGGVRVIGTDQTVRNNLFMGLRGTGLRSALPMMNGVSHDGAQTYAQVQRALVQQNTFIDVHSIEFGAGANAERVLPPTDSHFSNNLIADVPSNVLSLQADIAGIAFRDNIFGDAKFTVQFTGFRSTVVRLEPSMDPEGLPLIDAPAGAGAARELVRIKHAQVGPSFG